MDEALFQAATISRSRAHAPYSGFCVGAAVRAASGKVYGGCNIENASYGLTICAERVAIGKAISEGETQITALCVVADTPKPISPCGACRQVMMEFCREDTIVWMANPSGMHTTSTIGVLLPDAFILRSTQEKVYNTPETNTD